MNEREIAVFILTDIFSEKAYNNIILQKTLSKHPELSNEGRAFVTELVNGTLRNIIHIDYIINSFSKTPTKKMRPFILNNIRIGVYQLIFLDNIPSSAVCNEAVKLAKKRHFAGLSAFVNGLLRNIDRNKGNIIYPDKDKNFTEYLSVKYSYPKWMLEYWLESMDKQRLCRMCEENIKPPVITAKVNTLKITKEKLTSQLLSEGMNVKEGALFEDSLSLSKTGNIAESPAFNEGFFHIMDESSLISVKVLSPTAGSTVVDCCAAPGGKSFAMAEAMENKGVIYSRDIYEHKVELIEKGAKRLGIDIIKAQKKSALEEEADIKADFVLVDAPCSGLGMVRKKPDIKYNKTLKDIEDTALLQKDILKNASKLVKKGGRLVYSTCTVSQKENIENALWFAENFDFEFEPITLDIKSDTLEKGYIEVLPQDYGTDGFFVACFRRV
ncbi:MAG: 16S rRNA (cytosine(967)-C(5))-methyltransferase RsmB [Firmicutes bacterium]|nr:16S rRNA (cytosine(967)-C(5))-methyltransferase RsmB [Bacillota bacterium]